LQLEWHPLVDHCADVAATVEALLETTLLGERLLLRSGMALCDGRDPAACRDRLPA
jgi:hypothetical protein